MGLRTWTDYLGSGGSYEHDDEPLVSIKTRRMSCLAKWLLVLQERLYSMEVIKYYIAVNLHYNGAGHNGQNLDVSF
jgi:hypothetical protein